MDNFDRDRGGDRYINSTEQPHNYNSSGRLSRGGGAPFHHRHQDNYRGGVGGRESPHGFSSSGGRGGGRENHRPFESPPSYRSPPSGGGGRGGGLRPIGDGMGGFRPVVGAEGFRPMGVDEGRGFRPMGGGGDDNFRPMMGFGGASGRFLPMGGNSDDSGRFPAVDGGSLDGGGFPTVGSGSGGRFLPMGGSTGHSGRFPPMSGGGDGGGGFPPVGACGGHGGGFRRSVGSDSEAAGFQARDGGGNDPGRLGFDNYPPHPLTGQKRGYSSTERSPGREGAGFAKLFVGSVPRTSSEADIRPLFEKHGRVMEVALIKDKRTGLPQGCCFIKYASSEEADRAIGALHNQYTLPGGMGPIQVRYADGERERLGATEYKLFVGSLNKQATEKEVEEIFSPYGRVEDVYLMRDEMKQSRGCGFVKYSQREIAQAAINALNGTYVMRGCNQPLTVRFADPKRPRPGESRAVPIGEPSPRFPSPGIRPPIDHHEPFRGPNSNSWPSQQNLGPPSHVGSQGFANQFPTRSGNTGSIVAIPGSTDSSFPGPTVSSAPTSQLNFNQSLPQNPSLGSKLSPGQRLPGDSLPPPVSNAAHGQMQPSNVQSQTRYGQVPPSQQLPGQNGQHSVSPLQLQHNASSAYRQLSGLANQPHHQPLTQPPSEFAQMLSQQRQTLHATFQSSQQALNQLQQQVQQLQPANQNLPTHQGQPSAKQQSPWPGTLSQPVANTTATQASRDSAATTSNIPATTAICNWSEHTSPDGYKYYYNSSTNESKWEKPEELAIYEHQQQKPSSLPPQVKSHPSGPSMQQATHMQVHLHGQQHTQIHNQAKPFQHVSQSPYQVPGFSAKQGTKEVDYAQAPARHGSASDPTQYQQVSQEWMWKNKHSGI